MSLPAFRLSMAQTDGRELYGQGPTLTEALANLIKAANEYETSPEDREALKQGLDDIELAVGNARRKLQRWTLADPMPGPVPGGPPPNP